MCAHSPVHRFFSLSLEIVSFHENQKTNFVVVIFPRKLDIIGWVCAHLWCKCVSNEEREKAQTGEISMIHRYSQIFLFILFIQLFGVTLRIFLTKCAVMQRWMKPCKANWERIIGENPSLRLLQGFRDRLNFQQNIWINIFVWLYIFVAKGIQPRITRQDLIIKVTIHSSSNIIVV